MNVVDALTVTLGLDASGLVKGSKDATAAVASSTGAMVAEAGKAEKAQGDSAAKIVRALERIADAGEKTAGAGERQGQRLVEANKASSESVNNLLKQFLGLYALLTAGRGIKQFVSEITSADAALGRTARNIDMSGKSLSAWQNAATVAGGSAEGITGTLRGLTSEMQKAALTGESGIIPVFRALGINLADAKGKARDAGDVLVDLNRKAQGMDPARFTALAHMAGIDDGTIALLEKSTVEFDKLRTEELKYAATAEDIDAAQQRQSGWRQLLIISTSLGRTILTALTPAITSAMRALQRWTDANQEWIKTKVVEYAERFGNWVKSVDWDKVGTDLSTIATNVGSVASAFADAVKGVDGDSPLFKAFEAFGAMLGVSVIARLAGIASKITALGSIALPGWLAGALGLPLLGTAAVGAVLASGDPNKSVLAGGRPDVQPQDNDLGLPGVGEDRPSDTSDAQAKASGAWSWLKAKAKELGYGDRLNDDTKTKENIEDTAKATAEMRDILRAQKDGTGFGGVTTSSGGLGGSGSHADGTASPGARLGDRSADHRTWWQRHAPSALGGKDDPHAAPVPTGAHDPLKDLIAQHETGTTGAGGYDTVYGHAEQPGSKMAAYAPPKPITQMTVEETLAYQRDMKARLGSPAFPVGRGQWVEKTLRGLTKDMDPKTVLTPEVQEKLFDRSIASRVSQGPQGFRNEWDSLRGVDTGVLQSAINGHRELVSQAKPAATVASDGAKGQYPDWMDEKSRRELAAVNAPLARDLLAASEATGQRFKVAQGMRTPEEAAGNAANGSGVRNSQHLYGAAADVHLLDANGNVTYDKAAYQKFADAYTAHSAQNGGAGRWLGNLPGRWGRDIVHFDQGLGYGQAHQRDPYGVGGPTRQDVAEGNRDAYTSPQNPFTRQAPPLDLARQKPADAMQAGDAPHLTVSHAVRSVLQTIRQSQRLTHQNDNKPVPVSDTGMMKMQERTFGKFIGWGARHPDQLDHSRAVLHGQAAAYGRMMNVAARGAVSHHATTHNNTTSHETKIGEMHVHPQTGDGRRFAGEFRDDMMRRGDVVQGNGALA